MSIHNGRAGIAGALGAAIAGCVAAVPCSSARAAVVYSGVVNIVVPADSTGVYLNVESGAHAGAFTPAPSGWDVNIWGTSANSLGFFSGSTGTVYMRQPGIGAGSNAANLALGTMIGSSASFGTSPTATFNTNTQGYWKYGTTNILGFRFISDQGGFRFGWARVLVGADATSRAIVDYAYENTGGSLAAGVVPGPGAIAVLAIGLVQSRRRRR